MTPAEIAMVDHAVSRLQKFYDSALDFLPLLGVGLTIIFLSYFLARGITSIGFLFRWTNNVFIRQTVKQSLRAIIIALGCLIALDLMNATALVGAVMGTAGVVGIAVGFAFRDIIENYLAGILLSLRQPFLPNESVSIDGQSGKVIRLTSRATILLTFDGNHVRIPNAKVFNAVILNYSRHKLRRFDFAVGVGCDEDIGAAQKTGLQIMSKIDAIESEPAAYCRIEALGDSTVNMRFYGWVNQELHDFGKTTSEAIRFVKTGFDDAAITMPEPTYRVQMVEAPAARTAQSNPAALIKGDTSVERHLDKQVEDERMREDDLLTAKGSQE